MGVKLGPLAKRRSLDLGPIRGETLGIDVPNVIYRHIFQIRGPDGLPYRNADGQKIGHLIGLCNEISVILKVGIRPVFAFDGMTPDLKSETARIRARTQRPGFKLDSRMNGEMMKLLDLLGMPWVQAPEEAEAQIAYMTRHGCWASLTNDYDALMFGSTRMVRAISRGLADVVVLEEILQELSLDREGLVDVGVLIGTDYNPGGIRGIGPKRALSMVRKRGNLEGVLSDLRIEGEQLDHLMKIREYYLEPPVEKTWTPTSSGIDPGRAYSYLVDDMKLAEKMVRRLLDLLGDGSSQSDLSSWS